MNENGQREPGESGGAGARRGPAVIALRGVVMTHPENPKRTLLRRVDWEVNAGEFWVIAGLQGSGKTVLLETVGGLHPPGGGEVEVHGRRMDLMDEAQQVELRRRVGFVFEGGGRLFQRMTVLENLALPLMYHRNADLSEVMGDAEGVLKWLGLEGWGGAPASRLPRSLSQRVALGRALVLRPDVLLIDNPLDGADAAQHRWWRRTLAGLATGKSGWDSVERTLVVACQDFRPWLDLGGKFALAHGGEWQVIGDREAVRSQSDERVREVLGDV